MILNELRRDFFFRWVVCFLLCFAFLFESVCVLGVGGGGILGVEGDGGSRGC